MEGSIPPGGWPLPASLTGLFLDGNNISGPIPEDFPLPEGLLVLLLSSNQLSALPKRSFLPPSLTVLWVSNCGWAARVPVLLGSHLVVWRQYTSCEPARLPSRCRPGLIKRAGGTCPCS